MAGAAGARRRRNGAGTAWLGAKVAGTVITTAAALLAVPALASAATAAPAGVSARPAAPGIHLTAALGTARKRPSMVNVSASPRTAVAGTRVTLSATVRSSGRMPRGRVTFWTGTRKLCSARLYHRSAHCRTEFRTAGVRVVRGVYSGDAVHARAVGMVRVRTTRAATRTVVSASTYRPHPGQAVTLSAAVFSHSRLVPTGRVRFTDARGTLCVGRLRHGRAHCVYVWQPATGRYIVTGRYSGDRAHIGSAGRSGVIVATKFATTTTITSISPTRVPAGTSATVTVTVASTVAGAPAPTGTVKVAPDDPTIAGLRGYWCTVTLTAASGGTGTCKVTPPVPTYGNIYYNAAYSGDATHSGSAYKGKYLVVVPDVTKTAVTFAPATGTVGHPDTITATVTNQAKDDISPSAGGTGTVTFSIGGVAITGCVNVKLVYSAATGNTAPCKYTPATAGLVTVTAAYSGDDANLASSGSARLTTS